MKIRICMAGPSGTGKSTLAKYIAETYKIPFITTSTKPLWEKHGIKSHHELIMKTISDTKWGLDFQHEVLDFRAKCFEGVEEFVTDRSPLCNLVYFLMQNSDSAGQVQSQGYLNRCRDAMKMFNGIIVLPFTDQVVLEDDGMRIANKYYQMYVNATYVMAANHLMRKELGSVYGETLGVWDMDTRKASVALLIGKILKHSDEKADSLGSK